MIIIGASLSGLACALTVRVTTILRHELLKFVHFATGLFAHIAVPKKNRWKGPESTQSRRSSRTAEWSALAVLRSSRPKKRNVSVRRIPDHIVRQRWFAIERIADTHWSIPKTPMDSLALINALLSGALRASYPQITAYSLCLNVTEPSPWSYRLRSPRRMSQLAGRDVLPSQCSRPVSRRSPRRSPVRTRHRASRR